ncbi:MAG: zinc ribbon domain-containing protein [Eubacteriales bacterium]|nr:zinc ribbon domain-containing protein [Eubacteriales bacterium]
MRCQRCGSNVTEGDKFCQNCGAELRKSPKKKINRKKIIAVGGVIIAAGAIGLGGVAVFRNLNKTNNAYVYFSDGQYELLTDLKKDRKINFSSGTEDNYDKSDMMKFSNDGKYMYYYSQYTTGSYTGTLCRAEWAKLSQNSEKNEKYIDVIDTNISTYFRFAKDDGVVYKNDMNDLFYYNGKESVRIAKSVMNYMTDGSDRVIYTVGNEDGSDDSLETYRLYGINLDAPEEKKKLASDVSYIVNQDDFDNILYSKSTSDDTADLYVVGFDKERECLGEQTSNIYYKDGEIYYTVSNGNSVSLYDYVDDPENTTDTKENEEDTKAYYRPLDWYCYEEDYDEIYTSCSQACTFLDSGEQTTIEGQSEDGFKQFTEKYKNLENEQGYFLVTDEIKANLIKLSDDYGEGYDDEWLEFCFAKETEEDSYDDWADNSEYMREQLKDTANNYPLSNLCCYKDGKVTTISEDVIAVKNYANCFSYATKDMITDRIKLEDVSECSEVEDLFKVTLGEQNSLIPYDKDASTVKFSKESAEYLNNVGNDTWIYVYMVGNSVYVLEDDGALLVAPVKDSVAGEFTKVADGAVYLGKSETTYYYGVRKDTDTLIYDVYFCTDGKSTLKAENMEINELRVYDDMLLIAADNNDYFEYELSMISENGKQVIIADDVSEYIRADEKNILYISDGDLYVYDGKERKLLGLDVDYFWTKDKMEMKLKTDEWC